jgi:hypothetical protein
MRSPFRSSYGMRNDDTAELAATTPGRPIAGRGGRSARRQFRFDLPIDACGEAVRIRRVWFVEVVVIAARHDLADRVAPHAREGVT